VLQLEQRFKMLWADHGDVLSAQYAGTGALKSGFTRTGKRTAMGMVDDGVKSVVRCALDVLLFGRCTSTNSGASREAVSMVAALFRAASAAHRLTR
jgi:hypothetical protein